MDGNGFFVEPVKEVELNLSPGRHSKLRYFCYEHTRYIWLSDYASFMNVLTLNEKITISMLYESISGMNKTQQNEL